VGYFSFDTTMTAAISDANEIIRGNVSETVIIQQPPFIKGIAAAPWMKTTWKI
jgi:hypothetical protein